MANSPRFVVAFRAGKEPFGQHDFAGYRAGRTVDLSYYLYYRSGSWLFDRNDQSRSLLNSPMQSTRQRPPKEQR